MTMDDYFLWLPIIFGVITLCFCVLSWEMFNDRKVGIGILILIVATYSMSVFLTLIFENGNGHAIVVIDVTLSHRLIPGQLYEVEYQSKNGSEVLLRGKDGVRFYSFEKPVPSKFVVKQDYSLQPLSTPSQ